MELISIKAQSNLMKMLPVNTNRTPCKIVLSAKELKVSDVGW